MAKTLLNIDLNNAGQADAYEVQPPKKVVKLTVDGPPKPQNPLNLKNK
jgi:molybdopterin-containing oxidoreductase family iron-sulfur binding subunit